MSSENKISNVTPDFEDLVSALKEDLVTKNSWTDLLPFSGGSALIDFVAAVGTMLNYSVERAVQEMNFDSAELDYSKYSNARSIGVVPSRNYPASANATLTITGAGSIPAYTQFEIDGIPFYNKTTLVNPNSGTSSLSDIGIYQGAVEKKYFVGDGSQYQKLVFGSGFTVSEHFIHIKVGSVVYTRQKEPLWSTEAANVFQDRTKPDGSVEILFGNGVYGTIPPLGSQIEVTYAECLGDAGNMSKSSLEVTMIASVPGITSVTGVTDAGASGVPSNGQNYDTAEEVAYQSPRLFAAANRAVKRNDWKVLALTWPDVALIDAFVWGEHEARFGTANSFGPMNMNVVHVAALPKTGLLTPVQKVNLKTYLESFAYVNSQIVMEDAERVLLKVVIAVYVNSNDQLSSLESRISDYLAGLFARKTGSLGKTYYESDIIKRVTSFSEVDYCKLTSLQLSFDNNVTYQTVSDIELESTQFLEVQDIEIQIQTTQRV